MNGVPAAISQATRGRHAITRLGFAIVGCVTALTGIFSAALVLLCVTQPAVIAHAVEEGDSAAVLRVVAAFVVSTLASVVHHL